MAVNEVQLTISVGDNGSLGVVAKKADAAARSTGRLGKSTKDLGRVSDTTYRTMQGTAGTSSNITKNFAKQAQGIQGGLVPAYATLAANVFAITAAFGALQRAAQVEQLVAGFTFLGNVAGRTATLVAESLTKITNGALSMEQALRAASAGFSAGFETGELERLTQVANNAALALGRDVGDATDRLIRGVAKLEPEILDELGIFVRLDAAVEEYAGKLGKAAGSLTEAERRQAFLNKALEQGERKFGALTGEVDINPFDKLAASFNNLAKALFKLVNEGLGPIVNFFAENTVALTGALVLFGSTVVKQMLPALDQMGERATMAADRVAASAILMKEDALANIRVQELSLKKFKTKLPKKNIYNQIRKDIVAGTATNAQLDAGIKAVTRSVAGKSGAIARTSTKNVARIKAEIAALKEELAVLLSIQAARTGGGQLFAEADIAETVAISKLMLADEAAAVASAKSTREAFALAKAGFKDYKNNINDAFSAERKLKPGIFAKGLTTIKFGFDKAAAAARLFGTAVIGSIPFVGKLILGVGVLLGALTAWFGRSKEIIAAQKELNTVIDTASEKVKQYDKEVARLNEMANANNRLAIQGEIYANTLRLQAGFTGELAAGFEKLANALVDEELKNPSFFVAIAAFVREGTIQLFEAGLKRISEILEGMVIFAKLVGRGLFEILNYGGALDFVKDAAQDLTDAINNTTNEMRRSRLINNLYNKALEEGGVMAERLAEQFGDKDGLTKRIAMLMSGPGGMYTFAQALQIVKDELTDLGTTLKTESQNIDNLGGSFSELTQSITKFRESEAGKDKFLEIAKQIDSRIVLLKAIQEDTQGRPGEFAAQVAKAIDEGTMDLTAFGIANEEIQEDSIGVMQKLKDEFTAISTLQRTIKDRQKEIKLDTAFKKAQTSVKAANRELANMEKVLAKFDRTDFAGLDFVNDLVLKHKEINEQLKEEAKNRKYIATLQYLLDTNQNQLQQNLNAQNEDRLIILRAEQTIRERMFAILLKTIDEETKLKNIRNDIGFIKNQENQNKALLAAIAGAESAAEAVGIIAGAIEAGNITNFGEFFQIKDKDGKVLESGLKARIKMMKDAVAPMVQTLGELGPDGEAVARAIAGIYTLIDAIVFFGETYQNVLTNMQTRVAEMAQDGSLSLEEILKPGEAVAAISAGVGMIAAAVSALMQTLAAATRMRISGIEREIEAEQKRDGKSAQSLARIAQLEKKKEALKKKEFDQNKKAMMAQAVMATAMGIANAGIIMGFPGMQGFAIALMAMIGALGAAQLAIISGMTYQGGGSGSAGGGVTSVGVGERRSTIDMARSQGARGEIAYMRGEQGVGGPENFTPAFAGYRNRAEGGNAAFMVGEQGPELFVPDRAGSIVPNDDMAAATNTNVSFNINAVDAAGVEDLLVAQRGNIIGMIREAANSYGEDFVESVDTSILTPSAGGASRY